MLKQWLDSYHPKTIEDSRNALREMMQEIALAGLYRAGFYKYAAFYGGTALRIFYGLPRFSEDLAGHSLLKTSFTFYHKLHKFSQIKFVKFQFIPSITAKLML